MADNRVAGTLFVDMKYVSLYHKLGFRETSSDVFEKKYPYTSITIESEEQHFRFKGEIVPLTHHLDFVILELLDFLLCRGYLPQNLQIVDDSLILDGPRRIVFHAFAWGRGYEETISKG